jgi:iron complex outermembrane recepter protein
MATRTGLAMGIAGVLTCLIPLASPTPAQAQQQAEEERTQQEVIVTGSRIRRDPVEATAPLQVTTAEDIQRTGEVSVGEYLQKLPIAGSAINRSNNASGNLGFPPDGGGIGAGATEVDLRNLGSRRALVLVDGKRWIRGSSASGVSGAVDLNTIPVNSIERIEILQDGASPIYGSDAIAGVVNIITRSDYEGFDATIHQGGFDEGDGYTQEYGLSWGAKGETSRAFFSLGYARQDGVFSGDRDISSQPVSGAPDPGIGGSSGTPEGRFIFLDPRGGVDADGNPNVLDLALIPGTATPSFDVNDLPGSTYRSFGLADRFNFQPFNYLVIPNKRINVFGKAEHDVSDNVTVRFTGSYTNRESRNQAAPNPLFLGSDAGAGFFLDNVFIPADHPFNPFGVDLDGTDNLILMTRRPLEAGPRIFDQEVDTWIMTGTLEGQQELGGRAVFWDVNFGWGRNNASQRGQNIFNARRLAFGLGDPDECLAVPGCVPIDLFGGQGGDGTGTLTPEMLSWATFTQSDQSEQELNDVSLNISGELFNMPAGAFGYALGYEYRKESGSFLPDAAVQAGETADVPAAPTAGQVKVNEIYLELRAPLLSDRPFAQRVEVSAAVRSSDYDRSGRDEVFKGGLYWRMTEDFSLRFNYAEGFRAPNIGELFNTGSRFDGAISDPCSNFTTKDPVTQANCAALGVPPSFVQINPQISVQTGGNPNLLPESSDTWTAGFAYNPTWAAEVGWIDGLTLDFNYYDIELEGAIQALDAEDQLVGCVATLDPVFCNGITRGGGGSIIAFANQLTNIGRVETDGFDFSATLTTKELGPGTFTFTWSNTYLAGYTEFTQGPDGEIATERAGTEQGSPTRAFPRYKSSLTTDWNVGAFTSSLVLRYLSKLTQACPGTLFDFGVQDLCSDPANGTDEMGSSVYADAALRWRPAAFDDRAVIGIGINNLFDEEPPACFSCDLNSYDGTLYPVPGRFWYVRGGFRF